MTEVTVRKYDRRMSRVIDGYCRHDKRLAESWYEDAERWARTRANKYGATLEQVAGVIAAFSPRVSWKRNLELAELFLAGEATPGLAMSRQNAEKVYAGGTLTGPKTAAFAANIAGNYDPVTVDVWMMRAAGLDTDRPTVVQYREISKAVRRMARRHNMTPAAMQALIWIKIRGKAE